MTPLSLTRRDLASQQLQEELDSRDRTIMDLKKKVEESGKAAQEVRRLRDELDIMRERVAEAAASEERVNRLKKKLEETSANRAKSLDEENEAQAKHAAEMEEMSRKMAAMKAYAVHTTPMLTVGPAQATGELQTEAVATNDAID